MSLVFPSARCCGAEARCGRAATRRLHMLAALVLAALVLVGGCATERVREQARLAMSEGQYEQAVADLEQAYKRDPGSTELRAGVVQARTQALAQLLSEAAAARAAGRLDEAEQLLQRARTFDAGARRVEALLADVATERRQRRALTEAQALADKQQGVAALRVIADALKDNPRHPELQALQRRLEVEARQAQNRALQAGLKETRPISLDFRDANLRTVLDLVTRHSGVSFILDKDVRPDIRVSVYLRAARLEDAIDLLVSTHQLAKKVIDPQTVLIYPNTPDKQREHQEQIVKVFYLASAEAKQAAAFLRAMLKIREPFVDERANMLALRESPENIALAERLIALYDNGEPEVLLEVEVLEVRTTRLNELGIQFPDAAALTLLPPAGQAGLTLGNLRGVGRDRVGVAGVDSLVINLRRQLGDSHTLANPRIRVRNREKARVLVGDKIPVVTSIRSDNVTTSSVNYLDVGIKLEVEPTVYADDDVAIKVALEVSSLGEQVRTNDTLAYQIGTRSASTLLRLRDGETQLLAGLINRADRNASSRVPGIGDLPVLGRLFSSQLDEGQRTELVLAITPRVLRNLRRPDANETELWVGTEVLPRLRPAGGQLVPVEAEEGPTAAVPGTPAAAGPAAAVRPAGRPRLETPPEIPAVPAAGTTWEGPKTVKAGTEFTATLRINTPTPLRGAPLRLKTGPNLEVLGVDEGMFFRQGGAGTSFTHAANAASGELNVGILRNELSTAIGEGELLTLRLRATAAGVAEVALLGLEPISLKDAAPRLKLPQVLRVQVEAGP
jgi:general secretion pathway protein D